MDRDYFFDPIGVRARFKPTGTDSDYTTKPLIILIRWERASRRQF
jgi:hypothetical protein